MRIGLDAAVFQPPFTGIPNYCLHLTEAMIRLSPHTFVGFGHRTWHAIDARYLEAATAPAAAGAHAAARPPLDLARRLARRLLRHVHGLRALYVGGRAYAFQTSVGAQGLNLFHALAYRAPGPCPVPVLPVVYDLSYLRHPEFHPAERVRWMEPVAEVCRQAPLVHTISAFSAAEISALFGLPASRIRIIKPAVAAAYRNAVAADPAILSRYGLEAGRYALSVATLEPRKNLRTLIAAYGRMPAAERARLALGVVGSTGWGDLNLPAGAEALKAEGSLRLLGYVPDEHLPALYAGTRLMLYPSLYEGFGMPITEAMACGAPVAVSDASSTAEAAGGWGRLVAPLDVEGWTEALRAALDGPRIPEEDAQRRAYALGWTWEDAARATLALYADAVTPSAPEKERAP